MLRLSIFSATAIAALALSAPTFSQAQFGTAAEAKAMLEKAVTAVKADKAKALDAMQKGDAGMKDRDLYAFCANAGDGVISAHPTLKGQKISAIKDKNGKALGEEMMKVATEGKISEVSYVWPRPGTDPTPVAKVTYVTKAADQICGVGYYK